MHRVIPFILFFLSTSGSLAMPIPAAADDLASRLAKISAQMAHAIPISTIPSSLRPSPVPNPVIKAVVNPKGVPNPKNSPTRRSSVPSTRLELSTDDSHRQWRGTLPNDSTYSRRWDVDSLNDCPQVRRPHLFYCSDLDSHRRFKVSTGLLFNPHVSDRRSLLAARKFVLLRRLSPLTDGLCLPQPACNREEATQKRA